LSDPSDTKGPEMPAPRDLDASASPLAFFGAELRFARLAAGLSQEQLGRRLGFSGDLVGKIETGERKPKPEFVARQYPGNTGIEPLRVDVAGSVKLLNEVCGPLPGIVAHDLALQISMVCRVPLC